ncbi:MAG TPA: HAD-IC family P-type ATPase, partial [Candidatus Bathyarchaeia archaeon]
MSENRKISYWKLQKDELLIEFNSTATGLDDAEAARRLRKHGPNEIPSIEHRTSFRIFASQFKNPLVYVLVFASVLAGFLGDTAEATIIVAIVLANAMLGFALEYRSERAVDELRKYLSYTATVVRSGKKLVIPTSKLVPGDIVHLAIGDVVPADIRLLDADELQTDESVLTGESTPVDKNT